MGRLCGVCDAVASRDYDGRGFLTSEELPELGSSNAASGRIDYHRGKNGMAIPSRLRMVSNDRQETKWDSGLYRYDGALNVRKIGDELFAYDGVSRLKSASTRAQWGLGGPFTTHTESYTYDPWDNLTNRWRDGALSTYTYQLGVHQHKNRLLRTPGSTGSTPDVLYDTRGHVTQQGLLAGQPHQQMAWDPLGMQSEHRERKADGSTTVRFFLYGPGNLRFLTGIQEIASNGSPGAIRREIDLRNQGGKVLRRWILNGWGSGQNTVHDRDYVYDQTGPLATRLGDAQATRRYFFKDHLGSTRVVTNQHGQPDFGYQNYYPFGEEIEHPLSQTEDRLCKYTGHEREPHGHAHYMLGRHYAQNLQRFLSPDPARDGWNLYGYVGNNPLNAVDPTGLKVVPPKDKRTKKALALMRSTSRGEEGYKILEAAEGTYTFDRKDTKLSAKDRFILRYQKKGSPAQKVGVRKESGHFTGKIEIKDGKVNFVSGGTLNIDYGMKDKSDDAEYTDGVAGDAALLAHEFGHALDYEAAEDKAAYLESDYDTQEESANEFRDAVIEDLEKQ